MPTQKEIAKKLNISHVAVSYAMNGLPGVSEETRQKVLDAASEMGYMPNASALAIQSGKFNAMSLVMSNNPCQSFQSPGLLSGLMHGVADMDYTMNINYIPENITNSTELPKIFRIKISDGIILYYNRLVPNYLNEFLEKRTLPTVWVNSNNENNAVYADDYQASKLLTEHLIDLGHKKILYIDFNASYAQIKDGDFHYSNIEREEAFTETMKAHALSPQTFRFDKKPVPSKLAEETVKLLKTFKDVTAIVCYSCNSGIMVKTAALELGINCPKDISIVAFTEDESTLNIFDITTAVIPHNEMGRQAVKMVSTMVEEKKLDHKSIKVPVTIDILNTTGPVKS
jgi:DNA-binding LacI/PurR family transcriptional regulator